jgi:hypothetical protein
VRRVEIVNAMRYELWEMSTGNLVGAYETESAALRVVAEAIRRYGPASVATLALDDAGPDGDGRPIAEGDELARRALDADAAAA